MRPKHPDWYSRPELLLADVLRNAAIGVHENDQHIVRAVVLAVDPVGGTLENPTGVGEYSARSTGGNQVTLKATIGPSNPAGSVKARVLTDGRDRLYSDQEVRVFWAFHPQDQMSIPISPGEHVYVMFEGRDREHGLWMSRISGHDSAGVFKGSDSYTTPQVLKTAMDDFDPNTPQYPQDDAHASLAPAMDAFGDFGETP